MPPKVSKVSSKPTQTKTIARANTSSSSKSSGSSKSSSSSGVKKSAPPVTSKPRNVDKVDFGKPKTTASAGTYKPAEPPKPSKAELERIEAEQKREFARLELPGFVRKANEAYENYDRAKLTTEIMYSKYTSEQKKFEENDTMLNALKGGALGAAGGAMTGADVGARAGKFLGPFAADAAAAGTAIGGTIGFVGGAMAATSDAALTQAEDDYVAAQKDEERLYWGFKQADENLKKCIVAASRRQITVDDIQISYPLSLAAVRSEIK